MKILASVLAASSVCAHDGDILDGDILLTKCDFRYLENRGILPNYFLLLWNYNFLHHFWSKKGITVDEKHLYQNDTSTECTKRGMVAEGYVGK